MINKLELNTVIIVAGGSGKRMQSNIPKQFLLLRDLPVLMHTILKFYDFNSEIDIILVLPQNQFDYWNELCQKYHFSIKHKIVAGGEERFYSVKNGLKQISNKKGFVAVHDGVRPLVDAEMIRRGLAEAQQKKSVIPVVSVSNSIRIVDNDKNEAFDRNKIKIVQTPQIFSIRILTEAYDVEFNKNFTDDASVVEEKGHKIYFYEGSKENIKITTKFDLKFAEFLLIKS